MPAGGFTASFADQAVRMLIRVARHPATQQLLHHALRAATAQVIKQARKHLRTRKGHIHIS